MKREIMLTALCALAGCAATPPPPPAPVRIEVQRVTLPEALLSCQVEPPVGNWSGPHGGSAAAAYIVRLRAAHADCFDDVLTIAGIEHAAAK